MDNHHDTYESPQVSLIIGFITFFAHLVIDNASVVDIFLSILVKTTSLLSFSIYVFLVIPKIKARLNDRKKNKQNSRSL
jgi:hypothetical protein